MIKLTFSEPSITKRQADIEAFCKEIYGHIQKGYKADLNDYCKKHRAIIIDHLKYERPAKVAEIDKDPFLYLMSASYNTLCAIKYDYDRAGSRAAMTSKSRLGKYLKKTLFKKYDHQGFIAFFDTRVCPYCNRNYIGDSKSGTRYQLDHFWSKDVYPLFAVCFFNLVPSCASCNGIKSTIPFSYSPYSDDDVDADLKMSYKLLAAYTHDPSAIDVLMTSAGLLTDNINALNLEQVYKLHSDTVQELLWKKRIYTSTYVKGMSAILPLSKAEMDRLITGAYCEKENYGKRPLSKLTADISREIGLI